MYIIKIECIYTIQLNTILKILNFLIVQFLSISLEDHLIFFCFIYMYAGLLISKSASNRYHFHLHHLHPNPLHLIVVSLVLILLKVHEILLNEEYLVRKLPGFCYMHVFTCADPEIIFE